MAPKKTQMSPNARKVLDYLKTQYEEGTEMTKQDIAANLGISIYAVTGSTGGLKNKGRLTEREEAVLDDKGKEKKVKYVILTQEGYDFDPDAEVEAAPAE